MTTKALTDFGLVCGLMSLGYSPIERQVEGKQVSFIFEWDNNMKQLEDDYFNGRMTVDAQAYNNMQKSLKTSIRRDTNRD